MLKRARLQQISISAFLLIVLSSCATTTPPLRPGSSNPTHQLQLVAQGYIQFICAEDSQGYYWRYLKTEANLFETGTKLGVNSGKDSIGKLSATASSGQTFIHKDGSSVKEVGILKNIKSSDKSSISWMEMKAESLSNGNRAFDSIRTISRSNTIGGMPVIACEKTTLDKLHNSSFSAIYTFWK